MCVWERERGPGLLPWKPPDPRDCSGALYGWVPAPWWVRMVASPFLSLSLSHTHTLSLSLFLSLSLSLCLSHPLDPMRFTPCRDESMALGFGFGRESESERERERGERERGDREKTGYELFFLHAPPHTVGYIVAGVQISLGSRWQPS